MIYKVTKQFSGGREQPTQFFKSLNDAKDFAVSSAESDASMKILTIYRIYEFDDLLETIDSSAMPATPKSSDAGASSSGMSSGARFSPTPLEMSPRPKGTAPRVWSDDDDKNKDK